MHNGSNTLGYDNLGSVRYIGFKACTDFSVRFGIYRTGRIIQNQNLWFLKKSTGDTKTLSKASGVGAKTAARIVLELKDKVSATAVADDGEAVVETARGGIIDDAIEALMVLGYQRQTAQKALAGCKGETLEELMRAALNKIGSKM